MEFYEKNSEALLNLQVGEKADIDYWSNLTRVPGGWVYKTYIRRDDDETPPVCVACCFVPEPSKPIFAELSATEGENRKCPECGFSGF